MDTLAKKKTTTYKLLLVVLSAVALSVLVLAPAAAQTTATPDLIESVTPQANQTGVDDMHYITVEFNQDMNAQTINEDTFMLMQQTGNHTDNYRLQQVRATVTYDEENRTATLRADEDFYNDTQEGTTYTAFLSTDVQTQTGENLSRNYMWSFSTGTSIVDTTTTRQGTQTPTTQTNATTNTTNNETTPIGAAVPNMNNPWLWAALGLLLLGLLVWAISALTRNNRDDTDYQDTRKTTRTDGFGDVHPVSNLEGIGSTYTKRLHNMGILNTKQLWNASTADVVNKTDASYNTVRHWQHMAELASIRDVGPKYAHLLDRAGVHSIDQLKNSNPKRLAQRVQHEQEAANLNQPGVAPGEARVSAWINEARAHDTGESA